MSDATLLQPVLHLWRTMRGPSADQAEGLARPVRITRRTFLRLGAGGLGLVVVGPQLPGCTDPDDPVVPMPEPVPGPSRAVGVILSDPRLCGGCGRCAITCSALHGDGAGAAWACVGPEHSYQSFQFTGPDWAAATCRMCPETRSTQGQLLTPACVAACPTGAARIAELDHPRYGTTRVRYIEPERCDGCGACLQACPYDHPLLVDGGARKCDLCLLRRVRLTDGTLTSPPCVAACPARALHYLEPWAAGLPADWPWEVT